MAIVFVASLIGVKARLAILPLLLVTMVHCEAQIARLNGPDDLVVRINGHEEFDREIKVKEEARIERSPLFDNAPFLRLRPGDHLVTAQRWFERGKGREAGFRDYSLAKYLKTGERYLEIFAYGRGGRLELSSAHACFLFDWDGVTIEHGEAIKRLVRRDGELSRKQYEWLLGALARTMPEIRGERDFAMRPPAVVELGSHKHVVFEGISFDSYRTSVYWYRLMVGPTIFLDLEQTLIAGPPRVEKWEFEEPPETGLPNSMRWFYKPTPEAAAAKKKNYERMVAFRDLIKEAMAQK